MMPKLAPSLHNTHCSPSMDTTLKALYHEKLKQKNPMANDPKVNENDH
jgi:hypothetical protein